jgi:transcriptional regulator with XRE-family HTH domain
MARNPTPLRLAILMDGRTQRELAAAIGINETVLSRIVNGLQPDEPTREKLAKELGRKKSELWPELVDDDDEMAAA